MPTGNQHAIHEANIRKAMKAISELEVSAADDPRRLRYHFMAPGGWMNDPNGLTRYRGEYHMFYQIHPFSASNGLKHWGHAKSQDLVHWEHLPVALAPSEAFEANGCFSGTAVEHEGSLALMYTGNVVDSGRKRQVQCLAFSEDGVTFRKYAGNPVVSEFPADGSADFRDPKIWKRGGEWYMIVGSGKDGAANALLYRSADLCSWHYVGKMAEAKTPEEGVVWNCPDLFTIGGKDVLLVSPVVNRNNIREVRKTVYYVGSLDYETGVFTSESNGDIDAGWDFYAPQTLADEDGRIIMFGWMDMWFNPMPTQAFGWAGAMTLPREAVLFPDGQLGFRPVEQLKALRSNHRRLDSLWLSDERKPEAAWQGDTVELLVEFDLEGCSAESFGVMLRTSADEQEGTIVAYDPAERRLTVDRSLSGEAPGELSVCRLEPMTDETVRLHLFLDRSSLEVFGNDGRVSITNRIYPRPEHIGLRLFAAGGTVRVRSAEVWDLGSAWNAQSEGCDCR
jgi:beta-fructofuranosidase